MNHSGKLGRESAQGESKGDFARSAAWRCSFCGVYLVQVLRINIRNVPLERCIAISPVIVEDFHVTHINIQQDKILSLSCKYHGREPGDI